MTAIPDDTDMNILRLLQSNARLSNADLAREVGLAPSAVLERVKKLEQKGVLKSYHAAVDAGAVGQNLLAFMFIKSKEGMACSTNTAAALAAIPEVQEVHHIAGEDCFLVKIRTKDAASLMQLMRTQLQQIDGILSTRTTIVLETVKEQPHIVITEN